MSKFTDLVDNTEIKSDLVDKLFKRIPNVADGNCFFIALSHIIYGYQETSDKYYNEFDNTQSKSIELRKKVCELYKNYTSDFESFKSKYMNEVNALIFQGDASEVKKHRDGICKDKFWADSGLDGEIASGIINCNIVLLITTDNVSYLVKEQNKIRDKIPFVYISYSDGNHFEALIPKFNEGQIEVTIVVGKDKIVNITKVLEIRDRKLFVLRNDVKVNK